WIRIAALVPMGVCLVATYSRGGWALFLIGSVLLWWRKRPLLMGGIALVVVAIVFTVPPVHNRVLPTNSGNSAVATQATYDSFSWRLENWRVLLDKWKERPLLGYGLDTTSYVNPRVPVSGKGRSGGGYEAHNIAVRILVEGGLVLLATYVFLFAVVMTSTLRTARARWPGAWLGRVVFVGWVVVLICGLSTADTLGMTALMFPLVALTGAVEGAYAQYRRSERGSG